MKFTDKFVFFWGSNDVFSNFYYSPFKHQEILFKWSEQAVMYRKAKLFGATHVANRIMMADNPKRCKELGRSKQIPFDEEIWYVNRERIYKEVLLDKFSSSEVIKAQLTYTMSKTLVEASPFDRIWGIGLSADNPDVEDPSKWRGLNLLGEVLMEVREELKG